MKILFLSFTCEDLDVAMVTDMYNISFSILKMKLNMTFNIVNNIFTRSKMCSLCFVKNGCPIN